MIGANAPAGSDDRIGRITTVPSTDALSVQSGVGVTLSFLTPHQVCL